MLFHKFWNIIFFSCICILVCSPILNLHIDKCRCHLLWLYRTWRTPIHISLIISCCSDKARIIHFFVKSLLLLSFLGSYYKGSKFSLVSWSEVSRNMVRNLELQFFRIEIKNRCFSIRIDFIEFWDIVSLQCGWILILKQFILSLHAFTARNTSISLALKIFLEICL